jgi:hypothetical protein
MKTPLTFSAKGSHALTAKRPSLRIPLVVMSVEEKVEEKERAYARKGRAVRKREVSVLGRRYSSALPPRQRTGGSLSLRAERRCRR